MSGYMRYAQGGEEKILARIFKRIGTTNKFAVEFGAKDGLRISNTAHLRLVEGWSCLLLDAQPGADIVKQEFITAENINDVLHKHQVPETFDLLSIDIDGNDFHVWRALTEFRPRVVVIEYNSDFGHSVVMPYNPDHKWDGTNFYGASATALERLGLEKGYVLVDYTPTLNLIFVDRCSNLPPVQHCGHPSSPKWHSETGRSV